MNNSKVFSVHLRKKGFTLVEVVVIVVIIGLLVTALIPRLLSAQVRARDVVRKKDIRDISNAVHIYYSDNAKLLDPGAQTSFPTPGISMHTSTNTGWLTELNKYLTIVPVDPINSATSVLTGSKIYMYNTYSASSVPLCPQIDGKEFTLIASSRQETYKTPLSSYNQAAVCPGPSISDLGVLIVKGGVVFSRGENPNISGSKPGFSDDAPNLSYSGAKYAVTYGRCGTSSYGKRCGWGRDRPRAIYVPGVQSEADPYNGDTKIGQAIPITCVNQSISKIGFTANVLGQRLTSPSVGNSICTEQLGSGYVMAEWHMGCTYGGGYGCTTNGTDLPANGIGRMWINDQNANPR